MRFLAVLELYKQGVVDLDQLETFGTLTVTRLAEGVTLDAVSMADWDLDVADDDEFHDGDEFDDDEDEFDEIDAPAEETV